jgi:hypothetical protein
MEDSAHTIHHTNPGKASAPPPFFSKMRTFFKNRLAWFHLEFEKYLKNIFEKYSHLLLKTTHHL